MRVAMSPTVRSASRCAGDQSPPTPMRRQLRNRPLVLNTVPGAILAFGVPVAAAGTVFAAVQGFF